MRVDSENAISFVLQLITAINPPQISNKIQD
ncbi:hypothetical protein T03_657 [Trichinella britovi]|uniref:Uncharacterized protein n=1 Tax=Trichinella britovi TaxID=45882 RepID=A0A0V1C3J3_TRIBR|nr:hypothetical protein T03_657 [Trichinella britovi]